MLLWDIMSQMPGTAQDNSSQEKQDTRPITMASPTGMLVTERKTQVTSQHPLMFFYGFPSGSLVNCNGIADVFVIAYGTNASRKHILSGSS